MNKTLLYLAVLGSLTQTLHAQELTRTYVVVDALAQSTDAQNSPNDNNVRLREVEIGLGGTVNDTLTAALTLAVEQEYLSDDDAQTELEIEEAFLRYTGFDDRLTLTAGRKLMAFGQLNQVHRHHWAFAETPPAAQALFGEHPWLDDGVEATATHALGEHGLITLSAGAWNGNAFGHGHGDAEHEDAEHEDAEHEDAEHEEEHSDETLLNWQGHVFSGRLTASLAISPRLQSRLGYSVAGDEGGTLLHGADAVFQYTRPHSAERITWHSEWYHLDGLAALGNTHGLFSMLSYAPNATWELGGRYDWTEILGMDGEEQQGGAGFITYAFGHSTFLRGQYAYRSDVGEGEENRFTLQWVWGLGDHGTASVSPEGGTNHDGHQHGLECGH